MVPMTDFNTIVQYLQDVFKITCTPRKNSKLYGCTEPADYNNLPIFHIHVYTNALKNETQILSFPRESYLLHRSFKETILLFIPIPLHKNGIPIEDGYRPEG